MNEFDTWLEEQREKIKAHNEVANTRQVQRKKARSILKPQYNFKSRPTLEQMAIALGQEEAVDENEERKAKIAYFKWLPRKERRQIMRALTKQKGA